MLLFRLDIFRWIYEFWPMGATNVQWTPDVRPEFVCCLRKLTNKYLMDTASILLKIGFEKSNNKDTRGRLNICKDYVNGYNPITFKEFITMIPVS